LSPVTIRIAATHEAKVLTDLCLRSKAHWGYPKTYVDLYTPALIVTSEYIENNACFVAVNSTGAIVGFSALVITPPPANIEFLFVEPGVIGGGVGRTLLTHTLDHARNSGCTQVEVESDPHALIFYQRMGGIHFGDKPSTVIAGRLLPMLRFELEP